MNRTKILLLSALTITTLAARVDGQVLAVATATSSPTPTNGLSQQVENLKDRLATKVAELRTTTPRAIVGTVKSKSVTSAVIDTATKAIKIELTDDIKVIQIIGGQRTVLTLDDLSLKDPVVVFGNYDSTLDLLTAKVVFIGSLKSTRIDGSVTDINKTDYTLTLKTRDGTSYIVDIETYTKTFAWTQTEGITKGGFSKVNLGDTMHILGTPNPKVKDRMSALRILDLGDLTGAGTRVVPTASATATPTPTPKTKPTSSPTP